MKIIVTPEHLAGLTLDTNSENAILKANLPRAKKLANANNLLRLLSQHYGAARCQNPSDENPTYNADRWLDCTPGANTPVIDSNALDNNIRPMLKSETGILYCEQMVFAQNKYKSAHQTIWVNIPVNPTDSVSIRWGKYGFYVTDCTTTPAPVAVYKVDITE